MAHKNMKKQQPDAAFGRFCRGFSPLASLLGICLTLAALTIMSHSAQAAPPYASIVIDAHNGRILQAHRAEQSRHPASLSKLMTLYLMFQDIENGRLKPDTKIKISHNAAAQPASRLGLRAGDTITAREAVRALIVKSANDVATAVAEHMAGSEKKFAREMTRKARQLSMFDTVFVNASGLHNKRQKTTARDMARLAARLLKRFPHFEPFWNARHFDHDGKRYYSHNRLLGRLPGAIGMKTGYIRAAGYNIASVVERGGRRVIAVVIGGRSVAGRDNRVVSLVERHMRRASKAYHKSGISKRQHRLAAAWGATPEAVNKANRAAQAEEARAWQIQVGAYRIAASAQSRLKHVRNTTGGSLATAKPLTDKSERNGEAIYRARFANLSQAQAYNVCDMLRTAQAGRSAPCVPIAP